MAIQAQTNSARQVCPIAPAKLTHSYASWHWCFLHVIPKTLASLAGQALASIRLLEQRFKLVHILSIVQRDVRDFSRIRSLNALPRLLALGASQTAQLLNVTNLASSFQLSRPTIQDYLTLLERVFLVELLCSLCEPIDCARSFQPKITHLITIEPCLVVTTKDHTHGVQFRFTHTFGSKVMDHFG